MASTLTRAHRQAIGEAAATWVRSLLDELTAAPHAAAGLARYRPNPARASRHRRKGQRHRPAHRLDPGISPGTNPAGAPTPPPGSSTSNRTRGGEPGDRKTGQAPLTDRFGNTARNRRKHDGGKDRPRKLYLCKKGRGRRCNSGRLHSAVPHRDHPAAGRWQ